MRSGASQDGVVGADDGLDAGHSVHHPERQQEPMSYKYKCTSKTVHVDVF